jgi:tripartite-type tricarboxylate transporter receptor subunit TctC
MKWAFLALVFLAAPGGNAEAQDFPAHAVTFINPFPPGGALDTLGRAVAQSMQASLGQPVVVENVAGANGSIGTGRVARAAPDGYTVGLGYWGTHVANGAIYALQYDVLHDFEPVALLSTSASLLVARASLPAEDLKGLIAWLKANPERSSLGTLGLASAPHVAGLLLQKETGTRFAFVPYRGAAPAMLDLVGGRIDLMFVTPDVALPQLRAGRIKAYAVTARSRLAAAPDIPTADEAGVPGFYFALWHGLWVPKGTPKAVVMKLNAAVVNALAEPALRQKLGALGLDIAAPAEQTPEALRALQRAEIDKWWPILKAADLRPE